MSPRFGLSPLTASSLGAFQTALLRAESDKDKMETDLLKQQEKATMMEAQVQKAQKDRENLQAEMEMLLDRINKLSELLDKARVRNYATTLIGVAHRESRIVSTCTHVHVQWCYAPVF